MNKASVTISLIAIALAVGGILYRTESPFDNRPEPKPIHLIIDQTELAVYLKKAEETSKAVQDDQ